MQKKQYLDIKINGYEIKNSAVFHKIKFSQGTVEWEIFERYSKMRELHKVLAETMKEDQLPIFPAKKWFGNTDPPFIKARSASLQDYFTNLYKLLIDKIENYPEVDKFFFGKKPQAKDEIVNPVPSKGVKNGGENNKNANSANNVVVPPIVAQNPIDPIQDANLQIIKLMDEITDKFIDLTDNFQPVQEFRMKQMQEKYNQLKFENNSDYLNKFKLPNLTAVDQSKYNAGESFYFKNNQFVKDMDILGKELNEIFKGCKIQVDSSNIVFKVNQQIEAQ